MKNIILTILVLSLASCFKSEPVGTINGVAYYDWDSYLNNLNKPIILVAKSKHTAGFSSINYCITLKDGDGNLITIGEIAPLANNIGQTYNVNDTIVSK